MIENSSTPISIDQMPTIEFGRSGKTFFIVKGVFVRNEKGEVCSVENSDELFNEFIAHYRGSALSEYHKELFKRLLIDLVPMKELIEYKK